MDSLFLLFYLIAFEFWSPSRPTRCNVYIVGHLSSCNKPNMQNSDQPSAAKKQKQSDDAENTTGGQAKKEKVSRAFFDCACSHC